MPNNNNPATYNLSLTFADLVDVVDGLKKLYDAQYVHDNVESLVKYSWAIGDTEKALVARARIADVLFRVTGERIVEDPKYVVAIAEAKRQKAALEALEAEEAAEAARADLTVVE